MTARLTKDRRYIIISRAMEKRFAEDARQLEERHKALDAAIIAYFVPEGARKALAPFERFTNNHDYMYVNIGGRGFSIHNPALVPLPTKDRSISATSELAVAYDSYLGSLEDLSTKRSEAQRLLRAFLNSVSTIKRLAEVWPEGYEFYRDLENDSPSVPMVLTSDLNKALGLTPSPARE